MAMSADVVIAERATSSVFDTILHRSSTESQGGLRAMMNKDRSANAAAMDDYFKHWDKKTAEDETMTIRQARKVEYASLTRQ